MLECKNLGQGPSKNMKSGWKGREFPCLWTVEIWLIPLDSDSKKYEIEPEIRKFLVYGP